MASQEEKQTLINIGADTPPGGQYTSETPPLPPPPPYSPPLEKQQVEAPEDETKKSANVKRERLQRNPSLEKVDEDLEREKQEAFACGDYFGVKSYLHHFYDTHFYKDPSIYEEDDDEYDYLLRSQHRRRKCTSIWWKVFVWIGANFLVFGIIGVLVGYLVPQRPGIVETEPDNTQIFDMEAISFNTNLDVCKLVGLILFCIGGLTLTVALLFPSFLYQYCDDDRRPCEYPIRIRIGDEQPLKSPLEMAVPASSKLTGVQPERKAEEAIVTQEGMQPIKD